MMKNKSLHQQSGFLLIAAVILIAVIGFIGVAISYMTTGGVLATSNLQMADQAFYAAESGLEIASRYYLSKNVACGSITGDPDLTNATLGSGRFTVTATLYNGSSALSSAITTTSTTIPVASTSTFSPSGFISIDGEAISYRGISGNSFTGVLRGYNNTTPSTHALNAAVTQTQCTLISTGGVPNLSSTRGKRILIRNLSPQSGSAYYAVGNSNGSTETILKYNGTTWIPISPAVAGTNNLNGVSLVSGTSGWAVGTGTVYYQLSGSTWSAVSTSLNGGNYYEVYCFSNGTCLSAGDVRRIGTWTSGGSWSQTNLPGGNPTIPTLNDIHCDATTDCWTVGTTSSSNRFFQGSGSPLTWTGIAFAGSAYPYKGVFCNTANDCWAVGANATFARKNGANWADSASGMPNTQYNAIYCSSSSNCWAVGNSVGATNTIVRWNGTSWSQYTTTNPIPSANFNAIACSAANDCWAVGGTSGGTTAFIYYNGTTWSAVSPSGMPSVILNSVAVAGSGGGAGSTWISEYESFT